MAITPSSLSGRNARHATRDWGAFLGPLTLSRLRDENELLSLLGQALLLGRSDQESASRKTTAGQRASARGRSSEYPNPNCAHKSIPIRQPESCEPQSLPTSFEFCWAFQGH